MLRAIGEGEELREGPIPTAPVKVPVFRCIDNKIGPGVDHILSPEAEGREGLGVTLEGGACL